MGEGLGVARAWALQKKQHRPGKKSRGKKARGEAAVVTGVRCITGLSLGRGRGYRAEVQGMDPGARARH